MVARDVKFQGTSWWDSMPQRLTSPRSRRRLAVGFKGNMRLDAIRREEVLGNDMIVALLESRIIVPGSPRDSHSVGVTLTLGEWTHVGNGCRIHLKEAIQASFRKTGSLLRVLDVSLL